MPWNVLTGMCHMGKLSQHLELHARFLRVCVLGRQRGLGVIIHCPHKYWPGRETLGFRNKFITEAVTGRQLPASIVTPSSPSSSTFADAFTPAPGDSSCTHDPAHTGIRHNPPDHQDVVALYAPFLLGRCGAHGHPRMP